MPRFLAAALAAAAFPLCGPAADAAITVYTNEMAFLAATSGPLDTQNFDALVVSDPNGDLDFGNVLVTSEGNANTPTQGSVGTTGDNVRIAADGSGSLLQFVLDRAVTAFAIDVSFLGGAELGQVGAQTFGVMIDGMSEVLLSGSDAADMSTRFFGFTTTTAFTTVAFTNDAAGENVAFDDAQFGAAAVSGGSPVPEPASLLLFGLGGLGLAAGRKRFAAA